MLKNFINSGSVFTTFLKFVEAAAVAIFALKFKAHVGLLKTFFADLLVH